MPLNEPVFQLEGLTVRAGNKMLLHDVSCDIQQGKMLCILGESGAGKSTLLKAVQGFLPATCRRLVFTPSGTNIIGVVPMRPGLPQTRWVMQDPLAALNPRQSLGASIQESLHRGDITDHEGKSAVFAALEEVELGAEFYNRLPGQVSLGQAQRACLARALIARPKLIFFDEPLSALDALVQKKIARQMDVLRRKTQTAYVVVTHDLGFAAAYADKILVLRQGLVEAYQSCADFFAAPVSPYAENLIHAARSLGTLNHMDDVA
ncbi:ATP-binding cassette domain-containing protein [Phaeobacter gallaeciensis]|uniref:ATPase component of various ABC-type transport system n=1 Tax=Phaeobacter gallaeciensis TaxID=60890 RepID=A0AAC9ZAQ3_9RHOB|nr:dipeptide/oligopeptide/nickel ABC transporter ATP-binding protein [Phaeobacter gallaeciensis]AHD10555.1 ATPase component of various ABC-type transport system [Phaeobacter gallaeciensis DSM 26640]ATE93818.1 ATPase component of various ABC-type transport system [Phaeobacter gallaeciensis]ATE96361.1 ATPase component of various ABC-type transport system [Phaeobacter gallaeciensis]ATF02482.1 ATPase component of various ABC-type transport system [Phaeobacter gallaeciensis]ATF06862.1 ATPase compon